MEKDDNPDKLIQTCPQGFIFDKTLRVKTLFSFLFLFVLTVSHAQEAYWQQQVNFKIDVALNDTEHTLNGFARIQYINHSPDTLSFIWIHLWPNAYRTDRTAFSDQLLQNGRTDFYFANKEDRGYINRLDFRIENTVVKTEDHPQHIDIIKLVLPKPLLPGSSVEITTPFHVKLPKNFSRGGHVGKSYQITQWYPKPAVYDRNGWHAMPYLDQGEYYNDFGNYEVRITIPQSYVVLATGALQNEEEKKWLQTKNTFPAEQKTTSPSKQAGKFKPGNKLPAKPVSVPHQAMKTLLFRQDNVTDFAWFADKRYVVLQDTIALSNGQQIQVAAAFLPESKREWKNSIAIIKNSVRFRIEKIGNYPYPNISAVEAKMGFEGGMEYPCITSISPVHSEPDLESVIEHEIGHNWFQGMLSNDERTYPWLDEGINTYFDNWFDKEISSFKSEKLSNQITDNLLLATFEQWRVDQPLSVKSDSLTEANYGITAYTKGAAFIKVLEQKLGKEQLQKGLKYYFEKWKGKHPTPADFKVALEESSGQNLDAAFQLLTKKGSLSPGLKKKTKIIPFFGTGNEHVKPVIVSPIVGANMYDGFMAGAAITNYTLPPSAFQFIVAPMYGFKSKEWNGIGRFAYTFYPAKNFERITVALNGMKFTYDDFTDTAGKKYITGFRKLAPSIKLVLKENNPLSTRERFIQWRTFLFNEDDLKFKSDTLPNGNRYTLITKENNSRYLNQLRISVKNTRALYPYQGEFVAEQAKQFVRLAFTGNYYFNYNERLGANVRFFAGKFIYLGSPSLTEKFNTDAYHLNLTGPKGYEDYTYSNYFLGRSEFDGFASQQIMMRDGGFKIRTDLLANKIGKTDNWLMAMNFVSDIPDEINILNILPVKIPLRVYLDIGTYAEAWQKNSTTTRLLYNAGLQLSLLKNTVEIYMPILYSSVYRDYIQSTFAEKRFARTISFCINIQNASLKQIDRRLPF